MHTVTPTQINKEEYSANRKISSRNDRPLEKLNATLMGIRYNDNDSTDDSYYTPPSVAHERTKMLTCLSSTPVTYPLKLDLGNSTYKVRRPHIEELKMNIKCKKISGMVNPC